MILAGDIGGTKTHLALFEARGSTILPIVQKSYQSRDFTTLVAVLEEMIREERPAVTQAAFGIAGPIVDHHSKLTNLGWDVDGREVADYLGLKRVGLLNDLEATAYGTLRLGSGERVVLQKGSRQQKRAVAVIAAGTGLGEGGLVWDGARYRAVPSEGGHTEFGPRNTVEMDLLRYLLERYDRVSYERIVSGPGLVNVYDFFRDRSGRPEPEWLRMQKERGDASAAISRAGMDRTDPVCVEALDLFVSLYGAEAGNLALKLLATGGVFVGGGIAPKILPRIHEGEFLQSFHHKGRYRSLMEQIPVEVVLNDRTALIGAAHYALLMEELEGPAGG